MEIQSFGGDQCGLFENEAKSDEPNFVLLDFVPVLSQHVALAGPPGSAMALNRVNEDVRKSHRIANPVGLGQLDELAWAISSAARPVASETRAVNAFVIGRASGNRVVEVGDYCSERNVLFHGRSAVAVGFGDEVKVGVASPQVGAIQLQSAGIGGASLPSKSALE